MIMKCRLMKPIAFIVFFFITLSAHGQSMENFAWDYDEIDSYGWPVVTICVGESHKLQYTYSSNSLSDPFNPFNWVYYELTNGMYIVIDNPTVFSISSDGVITGLKEGKAQIKPTGGIHRANGTDRLSIIVVNEIEESEYNNEFVYANKIHDNYPMKFRLSSSNDVDVFKFNLLATPYMYITVEYLGESWADISESRAIRYEIYDKNTSLLGSGTLSFSAQGEKYNPMMRMVGYGDYGYLRFYYPSDHSSYFFPNGDFTVLVTAEDPSIIPVPETHDVMKVKMKDGSIHIFKVEEVDEMIFQTEEDTENPQVDLSCPDGNHPHLIDLGLPSGTKWACCNIGANSPEGYGGYYAWGETEEKEVYDWSTYKYGRDWDDCDYIGYDIAGTEYDVAHVKWGGSWRMPSIDQINELLNNCSRIWTTQNGVRGTLVTGPNGAVIFLPATGVRNKAGLYSAGSDGYYWSSSLYPDFGGHTWYLYFDSNGWRRYSYYGRYVGQSVRAVCP